MEEMKKKSVFNPTDYRVNGITNVAQIFNREDTVKDHWPGTQGWYASQGYKQASKKTLRFEGGLQGQELVYSKGNVRVALFMGDSEDANVEYSKNWVKQFDAGMITFRGHSYSLTGSVPDDVFGNKKGRYVFIPGSCGSSAMIPLYIGKNPETDMRFFSNTSTGRGQVTNILVDMLLSQKSPTEFSKMLEGKAARISSAGGDAKQIGAYNRGEETLAYINRSTKPSVVASY